MCHALSKQQQLGLGNGSSRIFHEIIFSGCGKQECKIKFDGFPADYQIARTKRRRMISVAGANEDKKEYDHAINNLEQEFLEK